ncbi:MAG: anti-sigma F factor antagonist [Clostridia bacterium]|nr:anti-sigma F factor antagonist [Clostridia bacterium]
MLEHARQRDTLRVRIRGELDHHIAEQVRAELDELIADERIQHLVIDMKGLTFMDSSGIGVLIGRYRTLARRRGTLSVQNMSPLIERIFQLSGLHQIIQHHRSGAGEDRT